MRFNKMTKAAEAALAREIDVPDKRTSEGRAELQIEKHRKRALRYSWLDCRSSSAANIRHREMSRYNIALRHHLRRFHPDADLPESDWELDALHERLHERA